MKGERLDLEQNSDEWYQARLGVITASKICKCFTSKLAISKAGSTTLAKNLACESIYKASKEIPPSYENEAMIRGSFMEKEAINTLHMLYDSYDFIDGGFYLNEELNIGASPDLICKGKDDEFGGEVKCPMPMAHLKHLMHGGVPAEYYPQVQFQMLLTGMEEWLFCSYYPGVKMHIHMEKIDNDFQDKIKEVVESVNAQKEEFERILGL